jgi:hypothetical protein
MFMGDDTVIHFMNPTVQLCTAANTFVVSGGPLLTPAESVWFRRFEPHDATHVLPASPSLIWYGITSIASKQSGSPLHSTESIWKRALALQPAFGREVITVDQTALHSKINSSEPLHKVYVPVLPRQPIRFVEATGPWSQIDTQDARSLAGFKQVHARVRTQSTSISLLLSDH